MIWNEKKFNNKVLDLVEYGNYGIELISICDHFKTSKNEIKNLTI
jgi:hypothetical protein